MYAERSAFAVMVNGWKTPPDSVSGVTTTSLSELIPVSPLSPKHPENAALNITKMRKHAREAPPPDILWPNNDYFSNHRSNDEY